MVEPAPSDPAWFRQVLGQYPTGVCVVTAAKPTGAPVGFVVGSFTSVSLDPPLVAFFAAKSSAIWPQIERAGGFCVNILSAEQEAICRRFAPGGGHSFAGVPYGEARSGSPIIEGVVAWIDCDIARVDDAGDHFAVYGQVQDLNVENGSLPLLFFQGGYGRFAPLSMAASRGRTVSAKILRQVDLVRSELETLARDLSARAIASTVDGDHFVVIASAGSPSSTGMPTLVGIDVPFVPPNGSALAAWLTPAEIERWLRPLGGDAARQDQRIRLATVRDRGYSLGLINEAQREFASALDQLARDPGAMEKTDVRDLATRLRYDPIELTDEAKSAIRVIAVPVFDSSGRAVLVFTVYGFSRPQSLGGIDGYIARTVDASQRATVLLGGRFPTSVAE
jgi:flavin reductase (DIM6/NTAB) family NADH-FMN oxidoreductase RutF/DNA-binding IclR family transcriptional regulator